MPLEANRIANVQQRRTRAIRSQLTRARNLVADPRWPFVGRAFSVSVCGGVSKRMVVIAR